MKKIIIFLLVVCVIVSCFTITTFAEETATIPKGTYIANDLFTQISEIGVYPFSYRIDFNGVNYAGQNFEFKENSTSTKQYLYYNYKSETDVSVTNYWASTIESTSTKWMEEEFKTVYVYEGAEVSPIFAEWFLSNFTKQVGECDGSLCPAIDLEHDNICDDCGGILTFNLRSTLLDYARSVALNGIENLFPNMNYWLITHTSIGSEDYYVYCSPTPFYVVNINGSDSANQSLFFRTDSDFQRVRVSTDSGGAHSSHGWATQYLETFDYPPYQTSAGSAMDGFYVDSSHTINFPTPPLWEEIMGVAEGEMQERTLPTMGRTMMILVVSGISLLALVILLLILSKKFRIFLP